MSFWQKILYQPLFNLLVFLSFLFGGNLGIAIIVLTLIIRLALYPSFQKTLEISKAQRDLQPKIDELREKHKDNKETQTKELMKLYKESNLNPLSSCLPSIIQLLVLLALYSVLRAGINAETIKHVVYSFMPRPENINAHFIIFDLTKPDRWILPLLAGGLQFWQTYLMMKKPKCAPKEENQPKAGQPGAEPKKPGDAFSQAFSSQMLYLFPIITVIFAQRFPAALSLYWVVNTAFSVYQQYLVNLDLDLFCRKVTRKSKVKVQIREKN